MTLFMLDWEGLDTLVESWWYQRLRTAYASQMSVSPIDGSSHAPISADTFYARRWEFSMRDLWTYFVRYLDTLQKWRGLSWRVMHSSISFIVDDDIHRRRGGRSRGDRGGP